MHLGVPGDADALARLDIAHHDGALAHHKKTRDYKGTPVNAAWRQGTASSHQKQLRRLLYDIG